MDATAYPPFYRAYIEKIPEETPPLHLLQSSLAETMRTLAMVSDDKANEAYAEGKWSIKEIVQHLIDTERILSFRALAFARGEKQQLPGFDHDFYVAHSHANKRSLKSLLEELKHLRTATIDLFSTLDDSTIQLEGTANGVVLSPEKLLYIIIGHEMHHMSIINERYL